MEQGMYQRPQTISSIALTAINFMFRLSAQLTQTKIIPLQVS